jgi:hypothetical protein
MSSRSGHRKRSEPPASRSGHAGSEGSTRISATLSRPTLSSRGPVASAPTLIGRRGTVKRACSTAGTGDPLDGTGGRDTAHRGTGLRGQGRYRVSSWPQTPTTGAPRQSGWPKFCGADSRTSRARGVPSSRGSTSTAPSCAVDDTTMRTVRIAATFADAHSRWPQAASTWMGLSEGRRCRLERPLAAGISSARSSAARASSSFAKPPCGTRLPVSSPTR